MQIEFLRMQSTKGMMYVGAVPITYVKGRCACMAAIQRDTIATLHSRPLFGRAFCSYSAIFLCSIFGTPLKQ